MKVFISWSGERSKNIANALREWLPNVIQAIQPWMSASDIDKGARWSSDIASQLEESFVGIICLTPENLGAPWILFEAGAISRTLDETFVCPYLFQVEPSDISGPLVQFQFTKAIKDDTKKLLETINKALGENALPEQNLNDAFQKWWPELDIKLKDIPDIQVKRKERSSREILEEILDLVRGQSRESPIIRPTKSSNLITPPYYHLVKNIIIDIQSKSKTKYAFEEEVIKRAIEEGIKEDIAKDIIIKLIRRGDIFRPKSGVLKAIE